MRRPAECHHAGRSLVLRQFHPVTVDPYIRINGDQSRFSIFS